MKLVVEFDDDRGDGDRVTMIYRCEKDERYR